MDDFRFSQEYFKVKVLMGTEVKARYSDIARYNGILILSWESHKHLQVMWYKTGCTWMLQSKSRYSQILSPTV